jgi:hypothetical protein
MVLLPTSLARTIHIFGEPHRSMTYAPGLRFPRGALLEAAPHPSQLYGVPVTYFTGIGRCCGELPNLAVNRLRQPDSTPKSFRKRLYKFKVESSCQGC